MHLMPEDGQRIELEIIYNYNEEKKPNDINIFKSRMFGTPDIDKKINKYKKLTTIYQKDSKNYYELGRLQYEKGLVNEAIKNIKKAINLKGHEPAYHILLSFIFMDIKKFDSSIKSINKAITLKKDDDCAIAVLGKIYEIKGDYERAEAHYQNALLKAKEEESKANHHESLGILFRKMGLLESSIESYNRSIKIFPKAVFYYGLIETLIKKGDLNEAFNMSEEMIEKFPDSSISYVALGDLNKEKKSYDDAIKAYEKAIYKKNNNPFCYSKLSIAYFLKNRIDEAIAQMKKAIELYPNDISFNRNLSLFYIIKNDYLSSIMYIKKALNINANDPESHNLYARALLLNGEIKESLDEFERSIQLNPDNEDYYSNYAIVLMGIDRQDIAYDVINMGLINNPKSASLHSAMGSIYALKNDFLNAEKSYKNACELDDYNTIYHNNLALVYKSNNEIQKAIEEYKKAISIDQKDERIHLCLSICYAEIEDYESALFELDVARNINPESENVHLLYGFTLFKKELYAEAKEHAEKVIKADPIYTYNLLWLIYNNLDLIDECIAFYRGAIVKNPGEADLYNYLANTLSKKGNYGEAIKNFMSALKLKKDSRYYNDLGATYYLIKFYDDAIQCYKNAIEMNPDNEKYYHNLALCYIQLGNTDEAISLYKTSLSINPGYIDSLNNLGTLYFEKGLIEDALSLFLEIIKMDSDNLENCINLATLLEGSNKIDEAIRKYENSLKDNPNNDVIIYLLALLYDSKGYISGSDTELSKTYHNKAVLSYQNALRLNPLKVYYYQSLARLYTRLGEYQKAVIELNIAISKDRLNASLFDSLGSLYMDKDEVIKALEAFKEAISLDSSNSRYHQNYGYALERSGKTIESTLEYIVALELELLMENGKIKENTTIEKLKDNLMKIEFEHKIDNSLNTRCCVDYRFVLGLL